MASAGRPQAGRTAARLCRWFVPKKSLCSLPKAKAFPREQWLQSLWSPASLRRLEVSKGERREAGIQWAQLPKAVSDRSFRQTTSGAHGSANRADCLPRGKPFGAPAVAGLLPVGTDAPTAARVVGLVALWENSASLRGPQAQAFCCRGLTRRLRRGSRACSPMGRSHFSFDGERKVCKRKPAARRLLRPAPLCVIRKYRRSGHCRARPLYLLRPVSR